jgi:quercetin dioxygenase-like cupin family protein
MPVLAVGGEKSFGGLQTEIMRHVATNVQQAVIIGAGHWLMEERPRETVALIRGFIDSSPEKRLTPAQYAFPDQGNPGVGSSGVSGIQTIVLKGDPAREGVYTIMLRVPAHTDIAAHSHRDDRVATVISGTWSIGYGDHFDQAKLKSLPAGSFYTEPPGEAHFAHAGDEPAVVQITGFGPSSTDYVDPANDPKRTEMPPKAN